METRFDNSAPGCGGSLQSWPCAINNWQNSRRSDGHSSSTDRTPIMNKVTVRAPVRADLAGGTLDLWPIYLFHPGARTVHVAISFHAESEVAETGESGIEIHLTDQQYEQRYESMHEIGADPKAAL